MSAALWKGIAIALVAVMLLAVGGAGAGWRLAAHDLRQTHAELVLEQGVSEALRASIRKQNRATEALGKATEAAAARGVAAQQVAAANGRRFDAALARIAGARATTCDEAMPAVDLLLESVR